MDTRKEKLVFGALICTLGYLFIAIMGACTKLATHRIPVFTVLFFQNLICFLLTLPKVAKWGFSHLKTNRVALHITRDLTGFLSFFCLFLALKSIPLVNGMLLQNTAPLWIPFIVFLWLKIRIKSHLWLGMIVGFVGVILILKPGASLLNIHSLLGLLSGIFLGFSLISIRRLATTEPTNRILFYYFLFGIIIAAPFTLSHWVDPTPREWLLLLGVGVTMYIAQILITYSFKHGGASTFAPIAYTVVLFSGFIGWLIWDHIPDVFSILGMVLVVCGGVLSIYFENRFKNKIAKEK